MLSSPLSASRRSATLALALLLGAASTGRSQSATPTVTVAGRAIEPAPARAERATATAAMATRATVAPTLDGRTDDPAWQTRRSSISSCSTSRTRERRAGSAPRRASRTTTATSTCSRACTILRPTASSRCSPGATFARASEQLKLVIDSYNDKKTGFEFIVNPAGVKRDFSVSNDNNEDASWDGVWDVATTIDSLGWVAEFRIPFSQIRFAPRAEHTFGLAHQPRRRAHRRAHLVAAPQPKGERLRLAGRHAGRHRRAAHAAPSRDRAVRSGEEQHARLRRAARRRARTLRSPEHRHRRSGSQVRAVRRTSRSTRRSTPTSARSRRIRPSSTSPRSRPSSTSAARSSSRARASSSSTPTAATSIAAAPACSTRAASAGARSSPASTATPPAPPQRRSPPRPSSRVASPMDSPIGLLDALTERVEGVELVDGRNAAIEPRANYSVLRLQRDHADGRGDIGLMLTGVNRALDAGATPFLASGAYSAGLDFRRRFVGNNYELRSFIAASDVRGSAEAIAALQTNNVHAFQRPDDDVSVRSDAHLDARQCAARVVQQVRRRHHALPDRSISGSRPASRRTTSAISSAPTSRCSATGSRSSSRQPTRYYRKAFFNFNAQERWTTDGLVLGNGLNHNLAHPAAEPVVGALRRQRERPASRLRRP